MYSSDEFVILGFPCDSFELQEPGGSGEEIMNGIMYVRPGGGFVPQMEMFEKSLVNGDGEIPLYTFLKSTCGPTYDTYNSAGDLYYSPIKYSDIQWNFEKFLIGKDGKPYTRYNPAVVDTDTLTPDIDHLLAQ